MKNYAYAMLNGVNGNLIRAHWSMARDATSDPGFVCHLLSTGYAPLREIILPNSTVLLVLSREEGLRSAKPKARARRPAR